MRRALPYVLTLLLVAFAAHAQSVREPPCFYDQPRLAGKGDPRTDGRIAVNVYLDGSAAVGNMQEGVQRAFDQWNAATDGGSPPKTTHYYFQFTNDPADADIVISRGGLRGTAVRITQPSVIPIGYR